MKSNHKKSGHSMQIQDDVKKMSDVKKMAHVLPECRLIPVPANPGYSICPTF